MFPISDSVKARRFPLVNILLIALTIFVFVQEISAPSQEAFIRSYALTPALVDFSNLLSLIPFVTSIFLHGGILHIVSNMWFLWVFGDNIEGHFGVFFFTLLYFISGIVGNILQFVLMPNSSIPMLGASGAVAGILGAYFVLFPYSKVKTLIPVFLFLTVVNIPAYFMLGYWFVLQFISGAVTLPFTDGEGGIAFFAHVGGFLTGVLLASIFKRFNINNNL